MITGSDFNPVAYEKPDTRTHPINLLGPGVAALVLRVAGEASSEQVATLTDMDEVQARMKAASALRDLMIDMQREVLRRRHPEEAAEAIEARLHDWIVRPEPAPARSARFGPSA